MDVMSRVNAGGKYKKAELASGDRVFSSYVGVLVLVDTIAQP